MPLPESLQICTLFMPDSTGEEKSYSVRFLNVKGNLFVTEAPLDARGYPVYVRLKEPVKLEYNLHGVTYYFTTEALQHLREKNVQLVVFRKPEESEINKIQRRGYLRVPVDLEGVIRNGEEPPLKVSIIDLGGGGISFLQKERIFEPGLDLSGRLTLPGKREIPFGCKVRRVFIDQKSGMFYFGLEFTDIREGDREKVLRYCFERQRELRTKGVDRT